ncbi:MAG: hypothetical protein WBE68_05110 [Candidatus Nitrosopolaris sp.]
MDSQPNQNKSNNNTAGQSPSSPNYSVKIPAAWKILVILSCCCQIALRTPLPGQVCDFP